MSRFILGITGASGMPYAVRLIETLCDSRKHEVHLVFSQAAKEVFALESDRGVDTLCSLATKVHAPDNLAAPFSSGSWQHSGMVVCPCSMASLAAIANGLGNNLIHRAADVTLKEGRPLILVPRETPFNQVHLKNMLRGAQAGATILPACPGFYHRPQSIDEIVDALVARILDHLGVEHALSKRWGGQ